MLPVLPAPRPVPPIALPPALPAPLLACLRLAVDSVDTGVLTCDRLLARGGVDGDADGRLVPLLPPGYLPLLTGFSGQVCLLWFGFTTALNVCPPHSEQGIDRLWNRRHSLSVGEGSRCCFCGRCCRLASSRCCLRGQWVACPLAPGSCTVPTEGIAREREFRRPPRAHRIRTAQATCRPACHPRIQVQDPSLKIDGGRLGRAACACAHAAERGRTCTAALREPQAVGCCRAAHLWVYRGTVYATSVWDHHRVSTRGSTAP